MSASSWGFKSPLAHLIRDPFGTSRRRRRRWLVPFLLVVVVGFALILAFTGNPDQPSSGLYTETLRDQASTLSRSALTYQNMLVQLRGTDRVALVRETDEILSNIGDARQVVADAPSGVGFAGPVALFNAALDQWQTGVTGFRDAVLRAADDPNDVNVTSDITSALVDLSAGDRVYRAFVSAIGAADVPAPVAPYPDLSFVPSIWSLSAIAPNIVSVAQAPDSLLALRAELAIEGITSDPEWVLDTSGEPVIEAVDQVVFKVVVYNDGNTASDPSELSLDVVDAGRPVASETLAVPSLDPQEKTTITFTAVPTTPGSDYHLRVALGLAPGDAETANNLREFDFRINESTPQPTTNG